MRAFLGIVAGIVVAMLTIMLVELLGHKVYPPEPGVAMDDPANVAAYIARVPAGAKLFIVGGWCLGAFLGGSAAALVGRWPVAAWIIGALIAAGAVYNATQIPAPVWMQVATVIAPVIGALAAFLLARGRRAGA